MSIDYSWLPKNIYLRDYNGDRTAYLEAVYKCFQRDFIHSTPTYPDRTWSLKRMPITSGKEATFWHITTEGDREEERILDIQRCERICWPRAMIDNRTTDKVLVWRNRRGSEEREIISLPDFSYVTILADRRTYIMLWTAYPVEREHRRNKFEREYMEYKKRLKS